MCTLLVQEAHFGRRIMSTGGAWQSAEAASVAILAVHHCFTELLLAMARMAGCVPVPAAHVTLTCESIAYRGMGKQCRLPSSAVLGCSVLQQRIVQCCKQVESSCNHPSNIMQLCLIPAPLTCAVLQAAAKCCRQVPAGGARRAGPGDHLQQACAQGSPAACGCNSTSASTAQTAGTPDLLQHANIHVMCVPSAAALV